MIQLRQLVQGTAWVVAIALSGCAKSQKKSLESVFGSSQSLSVVAGVTAMSSILDQNTQQALTDQTGCASRARLQSCSSQVRRLTYSNCRIGIEEAALTGWVDLQYVDRQEPACDLGQGPGDAGPVMANEEALWTADLSLGNWNGGTLQVSTASHKDYRGQSIGGGVRLASGSSLGAYRMDIFGLRRVFELEDQSGGFDLSIQSLDPIEVTQGLARGSRRVNRGTLEISHNRARFAVRLTPSALFWGSESCCHPTSGSLGVEFLDGRSGKATLRFTGCGSATLVPEDPAKLSETVSFPSCL